MSTTEDRIVRMKFDNAQFKTEAANTQKQLADLNKAVDSTGSSKGLLGMGSAMETVRVKASAMQVAAVTAIANIANRAVDAGITLAKSLTLDPMKQGFDEYELKMKSIQTILANTTGESLDTVTKALNELNEYSDKTIYNFANMTQNIGKLTTAGISLDDATATVKGFSNMVALAGGDATAAAGAMEQFGQGLQAGVIKAIDWQSISTRGLGSQSLQKAFFETAKAFGPLENLPVGTTFEQWSKDAGGFKNSLEQGWLTADVATETLKIMTGDVQNIQDLVKQGFDPKTAKDMLTIANNALDSATKVRTLTAFMDTLKEQIGSGWSQIFETVFGDFNESTKLFTKLSDVTGDAIGKFFKYLNGLLVAWDEMGGRAAILQTIKNLLAPIGAILGVISAAWKAAFPRGESGSGLAAASKGLELFTSPLMVLAKVISGAVGPVTGFFRLLRIGGKILAGAGGSVGDFIKDLFGLVNLDIPSGGGFIGFVKDIGSAIGKAIEQIDKLLEKGASIGQAFGSVDVSLPSLPSMPSMPSLPSFDGGGGAAATLGIFGSGIDSLTGSFNKLTSASEDAGNTMLMSPQADFNTDRFTQMGNSIKDLASMSTTSGPSVGGFLDYVANAWGHVKEAFQWLADNFSFEDMIASFNLAVLTTFFLNLSKMLSTFTSLGEGLVAGMGGLTGILGGLSESLSGFAAAQQRQATAQLILNLAIAIGILAVSLYILSKIPGDKLAKALLGLTGAMALMALGMDRITKAVEKLDGKGVNLKLIALSVALVAVAVAMILLAGAFKIMDSVDLDGVIKGLVTMIVTMKLIEALGNTGKFAAKNMVAGAAAIAIIAGSMIILAGALLLFKLVDWGSMAKAGVALLGVSLAVGALAMIPYEGISKVGLALLAASVGMLAIANALILFALVKWESIGKAAVVLLMLTASLAALAFVGNPVTAAGFLAIAGAMLLLSGALIALNAVDWSSIGKLAVVMVVLIAGFAGFLAIISFFAPALILLSGFAGSLALLAIAITGLTLAFAAIFPLLAIGAGAFAAFATGAAVAFAVFVTTLAAEAPIIKKAFLDMLQVLIDGIVEAVPMIIDGIKRLWAAVKAEFTDGSKNKETQKSGETWVSSAANGIKAKMPEIVKRGSELLITFLTTLRSKAADIAEAGVGLIVSLIQGISRKIGDVVSAAVDLIIQFAKGIGSGLSRIVNAGIDLIGDFLHDLADAIRRSSGVIGSGLADVVDAMKDVGMDIVNGMIDGVQAMFEDAMGAIGDLASGMVNKAKGILDIFSPSRVFMSIGKFLVQGLTIGIQKNAASAIVAVASMVGGQIALSEDLINGFIQRLDQKTLAAQARAEGLAKAARRAEKAANQTKTKTDDREAKKLTEAAKDARKAANKAAQEERKARAKEQRKQQWQEADSLERAEIRAKQAQRQIEQAKQAEKDAAAARIEANALDKMAQAKGLTKKQREALRKEADKLREQARKDAERANNLLAGARDNAADAMRWQNLAGEEAAKAYQEQFDAEAKADADAEAFEKLSAAEKAKQRREEAAALEAQAAESLAKAKELAYTDIEAANAMASLALEQADRARDLLEEAVGYEGQGGTGQVVNLAPTDDAASAFNSYADLYDAAYAAAARGSTVEFNQYNTSPESLSEIDIYRNTGNLVTYAADQLVGVA